MIVPADGAPVALEMQPSFSVVIPVYQGAATVGAAVTSALEQTAPPREVIVVDDGSTDDLAGTLQPFAGRICVLRKENGGAASARNVGAAAAEGDFVAFLDSDDIWEATYLEAIGELARVRPDLDLLSTDVYYEVEGTVTTRFYEHVDFVVDDQRLAILDGCFVGWPAVRRRRLLELGGFDESLLVAEDWDAWMRMIFSGSKGGLVPEPLLRYRRHAGSLTAKRAFSLAARARVLEQAEKALPLRPDEAALARSARAWLLARSRVAEMQEALAAERPRRTALRIAAKRFVPWRTRLAGLGAAVSPGLGRRLLGDTPDWSRR
jgi:glycosyltransferase involved in cell wall biosynthesis